MSGVFVYIVRTPFLDGKIVKITGRPDDATECAREVALRMRGEPVWVEEYAFYRLYKDNAPIVLYKALFPTKSQCDDDRWKENTFVFPDEAQSN